MDFHPYQFFVLAMVLIIVAFCWYLVRQFQKGRRSE